MKNCKRNNIIYLHLKSIKKSIVFNFFSFELTKIKGLKTFNFILEYFYCVLETIPCLLYFEIYHMFHKYEMYLLADAIASQSFIQKIGVVEGTGIISGFVI